MGKIRRGADSIQTNRPIFLISRWSFANAFPIKRTGQLFSSDRKSAAVESIELAHDGLVPG